MAHEIFAAIESGDEDRARELVGERPAVASERNEEGVSAALFALYYGRTELGKELAAARGELDVFEAAAFGDVDRLRTILDRDSSQANAFAEDGFEPLGLACFFARPEAARLLVECGADVNSQARNPRIQSRPLHAAAAGPDPDTRYEIAKLLLEHGADPNARQGSSETALDAAEQHEASAYASSCLRTERATSLLLLARQDLEIAGEFGENLRQVREVREAQHRMIATMSISTGSSPSSSQTCTVQCAARASSSDTPSISAITR